MVVPSYRYSNLIASTLIYIISSLGKFDKKCNDVGGEFMELQILRFFFFLGKRIKFNLNQVMDHTTRNIVITNILVIDALYHISVITKTRTFHCKKNWNDVCMPMRCYASLPELQVGQ